MQISKITSNNVNFKSTFSNKNDEVNNNQENKKNNKKLILALLGLSAAGIAALKYASLMNTKNTASECKNIIKDVTEDIAKSEKINQKAQTTMEDIVDRKILPFDKTPVMTRDESRQFLSKKFSFAKYSANLNGQEVVVEHKNIVAPSVRGVGNNFAIIRDGKTNNIISIRPINADGTARSLRKPDKSEIFKTIFKTVNEDGDKLEETFKNGVLYSKKTTHINADGSRVITINYGKDNLHFDFDSPEAFKKIIKIASDGTKTVETEGESIFVLI